MLDTDEALLEAWRAGDIDSGGALFHRHFDTVNRFFRNKVPDADIEDLVQKTFTASVVGLERFRGDASFRTYLFAVARRQLLKFIRDRSSRDAKIDHDAGVSSIHALGLSPSSAVWAHETRTRIIEALRRLPVEHQIILELFYWEQVGTPEIAKILEITPTTVRTRMHRARRMLETILTELGSSVGATDMASELYASGTRASKDPP